MLVLALLVACQPMESSGDIFAPVKVEKAQPAAPGVAGAPKDDRFSFDEEEPFSISSADMAKNATGAFSPASDLATSNATASLAPAAPPPVGVPSPAQFPVRLLSTVAAAQPPRAILGLASGAEVVVAPGSVLADEGLVVMMITEGHVQLAQIEPAGDHAKIATVELRAQYGAAPTP